jgi:UDP-N-acetyl-alpha-D-muramoyl-L-alanyl-L-glutamate epimerase
MLKSNNAEKFLKLRNEFPVFTFDGFDYQYSDKGLRIQYHFNLSDRYFFHPTLIIPGKEFFIKENIEEKFMENVLFQIGMIEMISYWKTACSPVIIIKGYSLDEVQVKWWKKLYFKGLSEFLFLNSITTTEESFVQINSQPGTPLVPFRMDLQDSVVIPVGGGKDSVVTLELLHSQSGNAPLILNPREASKGTVKKKGYYYDSIIEVHRTIDPTLLELNETGFLNGHTPFSALLAFVSVLSAVMSGKKYIALSNESSANENTVNGMEVNHQYSKSIEFEEDFRFYQTTYISPDISYFSFLRPLKELQISYIFCAFPLYFDVFKSCNAGSKTDIWCGKCPKCLFTFIILSPFLEITRLIKIFGKNSWDDPTLKSTFRELTGCAETKPFDCIGTIEEVNLAICAFLKKNPEAENFALLKSYKESDVFLRYKDEDLTKFLTSYDSHHFIPEHFESVLKSYLHV